MSVRAETADGVVRVVGGRLRSRDPRPPSSERIFEKFYRADPQLTRAPGGTGLGLYISRELVRRMGGSLVLRPTASGATFVLELPAAQRELGRQ